MRPIRQEKTKTQKPDVMKAVATGIVNARFAIIAVFVLICVYCGLSIGKVRVNNDLTAFLPDTTETRKGLTIMEDEFLTYGTADVMISNISCQIAQRLADEISRRILSIPPRFCRSPLTGRRMIRRSKPKWIISVSG